MNTHIKAYSGLLILIIMLFSLCSVSFATEQHPVQISKKKTSDSQTVSDKDKISDENKASNKDKVSDKNKTSDKDSDNNETSEKNIKKTDQLDKSPSTNDNGIFTTTYIMALVSVVVILLTFAFIIYPEITKKEL